MTRRRILLAAAIAVALGAAGAAWTAPKKGTKITVRVLSAKVMAQPKHIGATVGGASRGDHLVFEEAKGDWYRVTLPTGASGWIHKSNVTDTEVKLSTQAGGAGANVSQDEVELAGRGFTPEVEEQYREKHSDLDFSHVDAIEGTSVDPAALEAFVAEGKL